VTQAPSGFEYFVLGKRINLIISNEQVSYIPFLLSNPILLVSWLKALNWH